MYGVSKGAHRPAMREKCSRESQTDRRKAGALGASQATMDVSVAGLCMILAKVSSRLFGRRPQGRPRQDIWAS